MCLRMGDGDEVLPIALNVICLDVFSSPLIEEVLEVLVLFRDRASQRPHSIP